jgi:hypothetical protein
MQYFIPDWDDRVDPNYIFVKDTHQAGRDPYHDDVYAHEIYPQPPYDGILVSRNMLDANRKKHELVERNGIREYLRAPAGMPILGDCGAFSYWQRPEPPYTTGEMLEYYKKFGFTYGVSIDHLIFTEIEDQRYERLRITQRNAEEFLEQHRAGGYASSFEPIGAAQGWNEESYAESVEKLIKVGYRYIALGGLVRSQASFILSVLNRIQPMVRDTPGLRIHLFGVTRVEHLADFQRLGSTSFDSASRLRRAWMDGTRNYFVGERVFTAVRIPFAHGKLKSMLRTLKTLRADVENTSASQAALDCITARIGIALQQGAAGIGGGQGSRQNGTNHHGSPPLGDEHMSDLLARLHTLPDPGSPERASLLDDLARLGDQLGHIPEIFFQAEQEALAALRAFDQGHQNLETTLLAVYRYGLLWGDTKQRLDAYRQTLMSRPWEQCRCAICGEIGIEVVIFRGNNRNRRRGFHNTWHLYEELRAIRQRPPADTTPMMEQLEIFGDP